MDPLPHWINPTLPPPPQIVIKNLRFDISRDAIETFLSLVDHQPLQLYVVRKGQIAAPGKTASALVTLRDAQRVYEAVDMLNGLEVGELSDRPLECEIAGTNANSDEQEQAATQA